MPAVRKEICLPAGDWAAGINARRRACILAGGEPLLYPGLAELLRRIDGSIPIEIYTNLEGDVSPLLAAPARYRVLASLHKDVVDLGDPWFDSLAAVVHAGHSVRCHVVKAGNWRHRVDLLNQVGVKTTCCGDQRSGVKSRGRIGREVRCVNTIYLFGPDGFRYPCVTLLGRGERPMEHIAAPDGPDGIEIRCDLFGSCVGCDNNIEGRAEAVEVECGMVDG
ncbi:hypothetical protein M0R72_14535 [Candidatus Pacearchaeota archaeon]|nr:hypothetical protein [Candidatus Pacearchaeota archaeon]